MPPVVEHGVQTIGSNPYECYLSSTSSLTIEGESTQLVRAEDDGYDGARAIETAGKRSAATASSVSMTIVRESS